MTNRTLTTIAIRFAALLLFMRIFDFFGTYFFSVYYTATIPLFEKELHTSMDKFYYNGTFLIVTNFLISGFLFFKAELIASRLIKENNNVDIGMTPEKLIKVILLSTGIIWLASSVFLLPDLITYIQILIDRFNHAHSSKKTEFSPIYYLLKTMIALLFIFRINKIVPFLERKMKANGQQNLRQSEESSLSEQESKI